jgi:voltage-gated potassium channel
VNALRKRTAELLEAQRPGDSWGRLVDLVLIFLIFASIGVIILETESGLSGAWSERFWKFEVFSIAVFTVEYLLRLWSCVDREGQPEVSPTRARLREANTLMVVAFVMLVILILAA